MNLIAQGAEAKLFLEQQQVIKERFSKGYRLPHLDYALRQFRTRREAKVLQRLETLQFPAPHLIDFCDKRMSLTMDFVPGEQLTSVLRADNAQNLGHVVGKQIRELHTNDIVHGDLTTSNMLHDQGKVTFIDFGLSQFSRKVEDKAVDLHLFEEAAQDKAFVHAALEGYKQDPAAAHVLERLDAVRKRGRNKE